LRIYVDDMQFAFQYYGSGVGAVAVKMAITIGFPAVQQVHVAVGSGIQ
jgi:hypothetical protein